MGTTYLELDYHTAYSRMISAVLKWPLITVSTTEFLLTALRVLSSTPGSCLDRPSTAWIFLPFSEFARTESRFTCLPLVSSLASPLLSFSLAHCCVKPFPCSKKLALTLHEIPLSSIHQQCEFLARATLSRFQKHTHVGQIDQIDHDLGHVDPNPPL